MLRKSIGRLIGNGYGTLVWDPSWCGEKSLRERIGAVDERDINMKVVDLWDFTRLHTDLPEDIRKEIKQLPIAWLTTEDDRFFWRWSRDGKFSIKLM